MTTAELAILRYLARRACATASQIATGCAMEEAEVGTHLGTMEFLRLVAGRQDPGGQVAERVYALTQEGRRNATATRN